MQIPTAKHWMEASDPYGRVRERIEGPQADGNPTGITMVLIIPDLLSSQKLSYQPKSIHGLVPGPWHICNRGICLLSVVKDSPNSPVET